MSDDAKPKPLTRAQRKLVDASVLIFGEGATKNDAAFVARELVQASLPHKNPGNIPLWKRTNGSTTLAIQPGMNIETGESYGYPYGTIPRLLTFWITTEALRNRHKDNPRRIELGPSLTGFMIDLGLNPNNGGTGAKRSDARRLQDQMHRYFNASFSFQGSADKNGAAATARLNMHVARKTVFWWNPRQPDQINLWGSFVELSEDFYQAITAAPVPVDMRALKALKRSPLALDLYSWLTYEAFRAHKSGKSRYETWEQLHAHIGGEYGRTDRFRAKAKAALTKIKTVYPGLKLGGKQGGIEILPESYPALQPRNVTIEGTCTTL
jgi:hypothetical protein